MEKEKQRERNEMKNRKEMEFKQNDFKNIFVCKEDS